MGNLSGMFSVGMFLFVLHFRQLPDQHVLNREWGRRQLQHPSAAWLEFLLCSLGKGSGWMREQTQRPFVWQLQWGLAMGSHSTRDCPEPHPFSASPSNTLSDTLGDSSLGPGYCNQCFLNPKFGKVRPQRLPCLCWAEDHVHCFCRGEDAGFSSVSEAMACDFHVSSATSCPGWETSINPCACGWDTEGNKGLYIQWLCIGEVKVCVWGDWQTRAWSCVCTAPQKTCFWQSLLWLWVLICFCFWAFVLMDKYLSPPKILAWI